MKIISSGYIENEKGEEWEINMGVKKAKGIQKGKGKGQA